MTSFANSRRQKQRLGKTQPAIGAGVFRVLTTLNTYRVVGEIACAPVTTRIHASNADAAKREANARGIRVSDIIQIQPTQK